MKRRFNISAELDRDDQIYLYRQAAGWRFGGSMDEYSRKLCRMRSKELNSQFNMISVELYCDNRLYHQTANWQFYEYMMDLYIAENGTKCSKST